MDYEKATMNATSNPRYVNPAVVARPEAEVAYGKDTTPRYVGKICDTVNVNICVHHLQWWMLHLQADGKDAWSAFCWSVK